MMLHITYHLTAQGVLVCVYGDDVLVIPPLADICRMHTTLLVHFLFRLESKFSLPSLFSRSRRLSYILVSGCTWQDYEC